MGGAALREQEGRGGAEEGEGGANRHYCAAHEHCETLYDYVAVPRYTRGY